MVALGTPKGQKNSIAFGEIKGKANITLSDTDKKLSNVTFDVLKHSAFIDNGSSGGALLNASCRLVGVNYASSNDGTAHYSIPIEKVREFLDKYVWI